MQALLAAMFPLDYEDSFYQTAVRGLDNIFTWAAFTRCACIPGWLHHVDEGEVTGQCRISTAVGRLGSMSASS